MWARTSLEVLIVVCVLSTGLHGYDVHTQQLQFQIWHLQDHGFQRNLTGSLVEQFLEIYVPTSEAVTSKSCRRDSETYMKAIKKGRRWGMRMLDSSSKIPSGLILGNAVELGNYDECLHATSFAEETFPHTFQGQHCMVTMVSDELFTDDPTDIPSIPNARANDSKFLGELVLLLGSKWSVCVPSSCTPQDLEAHLSSVLKNMITGFEIRVDKDACRSRAHPAVLTPGDWFAAAFFIIFGLIIVASTAYDYIHRDEASRSALFVSFSLYTNGRKLLTLSPGSDDLQVLHGIRTLSILWVVIGHTYDNMMDSPAVNAHVGDEIRGDWSHVVLMNYRLAVDSFLLLSGLLLCYGFLKSMAREGSFNIIHFYLHRYIRLTPAYAVMILLTATLLDNVDDGPMWQEVIGTEQGHCKHNWWANLLYVNNYVTPLDLCMGQSWYLSVDMQLYLLSPLLLYPLWRWRRLAMYLLGCIIVTGVITGFTIGWINEFAVNADSDINISEYLPTHARFTPWVIGVALGYYIHTRNNTRLSLPPYVVGGGWILSFALLISPITVNRALSLFNYEYYNRWAESLNSGLNKPAWTLGVAWIVFACWQGYGGFINTFLSSKIFQMLSRLTYSVYLVHFAFILWLTGSVKTPFYLHDKTLLLVFLNVTVMSFAAALVLSLAFEVPALAIEKVLLGKGEPKKGKAAQYVVEKGVPEDNTLEEELVEIIGGDATFKKADEV